MQWSAVLETLRILGAAFCVAAAAIGLGRALWQWRPPSYSVAFVSGVAALSVVFFGLLSAGLYRPAAIGTVLLISIGAGVPRIRLPEWTRPPWWAIVIGAVFSVFYLIHALAPEIQPDGAGYHLGIPAQWLADGGFTSRIGFFELLPLGVETLFGAAMALGGASAAKLTHLAFLACCVALILKIAGKLGIGSDAAWVAALLFALAPVTAISSTSAYTDTAMVCAHLALFALLIEWKDKPSAMFALHAGAIAGLCYAIKISGAFTILAAFAFILWRRHPVHGGVFAATGSVVAAPWMLKAWWLTSNPLAPLGNALFDNDAFRVVSELALAEYLRSYGLSSWTEIPRQLLISGESLQGLLGPVFVLAPVALFALRKPAGRWLLAAAAVAGASWTMNFGARFLMPALPFVSLALVSLLPARLLPALLALHAALSLPAAMDRYAGTHAWRLRGMPWEAAFRVTPEAVYLRETYLEYNVARLVARHVKPGEGLLDLVGLPLLYSKTPAHGPLPTVIFDQAAGAMAAASMPVPDLLIEKRYSAGGGFLRGVKIRFSRSMGAESAIVELRLERHNEPLAMPHYWFLRAWPVPQDAALAVDGNLATRWRSHRAASTGDFLEFLFDRPVPFDSLRFVIPSMGSQNPPVDVYGLTMERVWRRLSPIGQPAPLPVRSLRAEASAFLRSRGIRWVVAPTSLSGHGPVGRSLMDYPNAWGVDRVEEHEGIWLFKLRR